MDGMTTMHECAVVGYCILNPSRIDDLDFELSGYRWVDECCGKLWPVMLSMRRKGVPLMDHVGLSQLKKEAGVLASDLAKICGEQAAFGHTVDYHIGQLCDARMRSQLLTAVSKMQSMLEGKTESTNDIIEWAGRHLLSQSYTVRGKTHIGELMKEVANLSSDPKSNIPSVQVGIPSFDNTTGGLREGQLIVLAARPSVGKSALAAQFAINVAKTNGRVLFISLEMSGQEIASRAIAYETSISMKHLLDGSLANHTIDQVKKLASDYLANVPLFVEDRSRMTLQKVSMLVRQYASRHKLSMVVIDYLQLIDPPHVRMQEREVIEHNTKGLKQLAKAEKVPILVLSQLTRESEKDSKGMQAPTLAQLRGSGSIEQDADMVILLHRETRSSKDATMIVAKGRNVGTGRIELEYVGPKFEFLPSVSVVASEFSGDFNNFG